MNRSDQELADRMADMEPDLRELLLWEVNSLVRWDVLRFYLEMEQDTATLDELALACGRTPEELLAVTGSLVSAGWLARRTQDGATTYVLSQEQGRRAALSRLRAALHDRDFQLKALYHWLKPGDR